VINEVLFKFCKKIIFLLFINNKNAYVCLYLYDNKNNKIIICFIIKLNINKFNNLIMNKFYLFYT